jgi:hypothetical protein
VSLTGYALTVCRTLAYGGDCGDVIASSYILGNCHPTGYPLYLVLGKLLAALPAGDVAFRYNLLSAVSAAGAVFVLALFVAEVTGRGTAGLFAGVTFGFLYAVWTQSVLAEVYTLGLLFAALILLAAHRWETRNDARWLLAAAFLSGLAAAHHLSSVYVSVPALVYCVAACRRRPGALRLLPWALALGLCGLLLYAYLPIRAAAQPALNWGDPSTWDRFLAHVSGRLYRSHVFGTPLSAVPGRLAAYGVLVGLQFFLSAVWIPVGIVWLCRRNRGCAGLLGAVWAFNVVANIRYDVGDLWNFLLPSFLALAAFAGAGMAAFTSALARRYSQSRMPGLVPGVAALACVAMQASITAPVPDVNLRDNRTAREYNEHVLEALPPHAALFVESDENLFALQYLQHVEGKGTSVELLSVPALEAFGDGLAAEVSRRLGRRPLFCAFYPQQLVAQYSLRCSDTVTEIRASPAEVRSHDGGVGGKPVLLHGSGVAVGSLSPQRAAVKKGNSVGVQFRWTKEPNASLGPVNVELLCVPGSPGEADPDSDPDSSRSILTVSDTVTRWSATYPLAGGRALSGVPLARGHSVEERACLTVPWDAQTGRYQVFARVCPADGVPSEYQGIMDLSAVQR